MGKLFVNGGWDVCYIQLLISTLYVSGCNCAALCRRLPAKNAKRCLSNVTMRCSLACLLRKHLLWQEEWRMGYDKIHGNAVMTVTYTLTCKHRKQCSGVYTYVEHTYIYTSAIMTWQRVSTHRLLHILQLKTCQYTYLHFQRKCKLSSNFQSSTAHRTSKCTCSLTWSRSW